MTMRRLPAALLLALACGATAVAADPRQDFMTAFSGDDLDVKRQALATMTASPMPDSEVLPMLVLATGDRQAHDDAVQALRRRTGLTPPINEGQSHYPAYPPSDDPLSWQYWLSDWQREHSREQRIDAAIADAGSALRDAQEAQTAVREANGEQASGSTPGR
jgi:hypothetical protein